MIARILILLLPLLFLCDCSKENKSERAKSGKSSRSGLSQYILDQAPPISHPLDIEYGGKVALLGYQVEPAGVIPQSKKITLTLYWRLNQPLTGNWKLMTHVLDGLGEKVLDLYDRSPIRKGPRGKPALRPSSWKTGKVYVDKLTFQLPSKMKSDQIRIVASIYSTSAVRMPVTKGPMLDRDRALVASFKVALEGKSRELVVPTLSLNRLEDDAKITVDGKLSEPAWEKAEVLGPLIDVKTGDARPTFGGKARLLWNAQALYLAYEIDDKDVVGGFPAGKRDAELWTKDAVGLLVDPDGSGDGKNYYEVAINPQNLVFDSQFDVEKEPRKAPNGAPPGFPNWTSNLKSAVSVDGTLDKEGDEDKGYVVEAMIPWKSFGRAKRVPPELGDRWRLNLYATSGAERVSWSAAFGKGNLHETSRFGSVLFTKEGFTPPAASASAAPSAAPAPSGGPSASVKASASSKPASSAKPAPAPKPAASP